MVDKTYRIELRMYIDGNPEYHRGSDWSDYLGERFRLILNCAEQHSNFGIMLYRGKDRGYYLFDTTSEKLATIMKLKFG